MPLIAWIAFTNAAADIVLLYTEPLAANTNTSSSFVPEARLSNLTDPFTSRFAVGLFVPIPIFPAESIRIASLLLVFITRGLLSIVPKKLVAALVPLLPVNDQFEFAAAISAIFFQAPLLRRRKLLSAFK